MPPPAGSWAPTGAPVAGPGPAGGPLPALGPTPAPSRGNRGCLIAVGVVSALALLVAVAVVAVLVFVGKTANDLYGTPAMTDYATTIDTCGTDITGMSVKGTITNKTDTPHTYRLTVVFKGSSGETIDTDGLILIPTVGPGQTTPWDGFSFRTPAEGVTPKCVVSEVVYNG